MMLADNINWGLIWLLFLFGAMAVVWLYALVNCARRADFSRGEKLAWGLVLVFTNYVGLIAYFIFSSNRKKKNSMPVSRYPKAIDPATGRPLV